MGKASASQDHLAHEQSDHAHEEDAHVVTAQRDADREEPATFENAENESAAADEVVAELSVLQPLAVRETQRLYRLKAARFVAVVAADTEDEARLLAARHDPLRADWGNPEFASIEFDDTADRHVFGDVIIFALAAVPLKASRKR